MDTVLKTGPGVWELRAKKKARARSTSTTTTLKAIPSFTHMTLLELEKAGHLAYLISQNTDGLHRRSGFPPEKLAEVHGNSNLEVCDTCSHQYLRDYRARNAKGKGKVHYHYTGRRCAVEGCNGKLQDTIINFGEEPRQLDEGFAHAYESDLCLAMGSSLRVTPAADMPEIVADKGRLVIVNLQKTPLDDKAAMVIHAKTDDVMRLLAAELGLSVPSFRLRRFIEVTTKRRGRASGPTTVSTRGVDIDGTPFSLFTSAHVKVGEKKSKKVMEEPFNFPVADLSHTSLHVAFAGHYGETALSFPVPQLPKGEKSLTHTYTCLWNPLTREWEEQTRRGDEAVTHAATAAAPDAAEREAGHGGAGPTDTDVESLADHVCTL